MTNPDTELEQLNLTYAQIQIIKQREARMVREAVYNLHEYIMLKNIIRQETDQAYNYARLHRAIDEYIAQLQANKE